MAKRLFFVSAAILMLMVAYHLGARNAQAQGGMQVRWVGPEAEFVIGSGPVYRFVSDAWQSLAAYGWPTPPVPSDQILWWHNGYLVTTGGEAFRWDGSSWVSVGFIPGAGTINVQPETWGGVKQKYR